ncbi:hypothetical protein [Bradyrhizobium sp. BR 10261]|nr:hypothetical protein [Bradyrhizobium sp. BR 10261]MBW7962777.1 hypothetical protein [Bradyrhizobium sp. BR 10261]
MGKSATIDFATATLPKLEAFDGAAVLQMSGAATVTSLCGGAEPCVR